MVAAMVVLVVVAVVVATVVVVVAVVVAEDHNHGHISKSGLHKGFENEVYSFQRKAIRHVVSLCFL